MEQQVVWQAVLVRVIRDLMSAGFSNASFREDAERWVGSYPSADFRLVCQLAGFDYLRAHRVLMAACRVPPEQRFQLLEKLDQAQSTGAGWTAVMADARRAAEAIAA